MYDDTELRWGIVDLFYEAQTYMRNSIRAVWGRNLPNVDSEPACPACGQAFQYVQQLSDHKYRAHGLKVSQAERLERMREYSKRRRIALHTH